MHKFGLIIPFVISWLFPCNSHGQIHSKLATGDWYKIAVTESNIYAISGSDLESYGISLSNVDPNKIRLFGNPGGILPQANSAPRPLDLEEISIKIIDGGDGSFSTSDKIIFWAEGPDKITFNENSKLFEYEKNIYSDTSFYFININQSAGKVIQNQNSIIGSFPIINTHLTYFRHELDQVNIRQSGRAWYGEKFDTQTLNQTFTTNINNWIEGSTAKLISSVMAASFNPSKFIVKMNEAEIGTHQISNIPEGTYSIKGIEDNQQFTSILSAPNGTNLEVNYIYEKQNGSAYLNYFLIQVEQFITYNSSPLIITIPKQAQPISTLQATFEGANLNLWDITNLNNVQNLDFQINSNLIANINTDTTAHLVLFSSSQQLPTPKFISKITNQDLHNITSTELLIITPPEFLTQALDLKSYKLSKGISTEVATTYQIYNEFSSGRKDITAIRDFAKYLYNHAGLKYVLLFGKGTYDYKNIDENNNSFIPIYESRNSLSPLYTYGSDDYIGFMEDNEGDWLENLQGDHTMDIGVGRLPVKSKEEAQAVVNKIIKYNSKNSIGDWKKKIYFVAENGDSNIHQRDAERLSILIDSTYSSYDPQKIYVDAFPIEVYPGAIKAPQVNEAINNTIDNGALIVNYTGHGSEKQWAQSSILTMDMIDRFTNENSLPLFVTATCEFGRHDDGNLISAGEELVIKPNAGAIGLITTSRPVFATSNYVLNLAFYNEVLSTNMGEYKTLGDIFKATKNNSLSGPNNRNFSLLADPSLKLAYPEMQVQLDSVNNNPVQVTDTLKALEKAVISGSIRYPNGTIINSFNGEVLIKFYDRPTNKKTLGNFDSPFDYVVRDNFIFNGKSTIVNGKFNFELIVPLDINYQPEKGKVSMYAISTDSLDATGANISLVIGGSSSNPIEDNTPPIINLYLEDTTFQNNSLVSANSLLLAHIFDNSGINLSKSQVGHHIVFILDNEEPISLNDYFEYDINSFQKGKLAYPLQNIKPGNHIIKLKAWDAYNNYSEKEIIFKVASEQEVIISDVSVFPNPMLNHANFSFKHNLSGNDITVNLKILNRAGQAVYSKETIYHNANATINDLQWDGKNQTGQKLAEGLYIYHINIRSNNSEATNSYFGRLITVN